MERQVIRSWDGNDATYGPDQFMVNVVNGPTLLNTTFACSVSQATQGYPGDASGRNPPLTGSVEHGTLGYILGPGSPMDVDAVYHLTYTFDHSGGSVGFDFTGSGLQGLTDESWGLDNVSVQAIQNP
jgi:hypothetical protein